GVVLRWSSSRLSGCTRRAGASMASGSARPLFWGRYEGVRQPPPPTRHEAIAPAASVERQGGFPSLIAGISPRRASSYASERPTPFNFAGAGWAHRTEYCCKECARQADLERRRQGYVSVRPSEEFGEWQSCKRCGEEFMPRRSGAVCCSTGCRVAAHRAKAA